MIGYNNISDINILKEVNFPKLEILNLYWINTFDINILGDVNFQKLKIINLNKYKCIWKS